MRTTITMRMKFLKFRAWKFPKYFRAVNRYVITENFTVWYGSSSKRNVPVEGNMRIQFDYVPAENSLKETNSDIDYTRRLCVIGQNLDMIALASLF